MYWLMDSKFSTTKFQFGLLSRWGFNHSQAIRGFAIGQLHNALEKASKPKIHMLQTQYWVTFDWPLLNWRAHLNMASLLVSGAFWMTLFVNSATELFIMCTNCANITWSTILTKLPRRLQNNKSCVSKGFSMKCHEIQVNWYLNSSIIFIRICLEWYLDGDSWERTVMLASFKAKKAWSHAILG